MTVRLKTSLVAATLTVAAGGADPAPPATRPATAPVHTTIVVDGRSVRVRGRVCTVVNVDGDVTVNGRPLAEVLDEPPVVPATGPATRP